jgi:hypothetical protein
LKSQWDTPSPIQVPADVLTSHRSRCVQFNAAGTLSITSMGRYLLCISVCRPTTHISCDLFAFCRRSLPGYDVLEAQIPDGRETCWRQKPSLVV